MDRVDRPQNYKGLYGILQGTHLDNFSLKTLTLGCVAFHSVTFQLNCLDFPSNQRNSPQSSTFLQWTAIAGRLYVGR